MTSWPCEIKALVQLYHDEEQRVQILFLKLHSMTLQMCTPVWNNRYLTCEFEFLVTHLISLHWPFLCQGLLRLHHAEQLLSPPHPVLTSLGPENGACFGTRSLLVQLKILS